MSFDFDDIFGTGKSSTKKSNPLDFGNFITSKKNRKRGGFDDILGMAGIGTNSQFVGFGRTKSQGDFATIVKRKRRSRESIALGVRDDSAIFGLQNFGNAVGRSENFLDTESRPKIASDGRRIKKAVKQTGRFQLTDEIKEVDIFTTDPSGRTVKKKVMRKTGRRVVVTDQLGNPIRPKTGGTNLVFGRELRPSVKSFIRNQKTKRKIKQTTRGKTPTSITSINTSSQNLFRADVIPAKAKKQKKGGNYLDPRKPPEMFETAKAKKQKKGGNYLTQAIPQPSDDILTSTGKKQKKRTNTQDQINPTTFGDFTGGIDKKEKERKDKIKQRSGIIKNVVAGKILKDNKSSALDEIINPKSVTNITGQINPNRFDDEKERPLIIADGKKFVRSNKNKKKQERSLFLKTINSDSLKKEHILQLGELVKKDKIFEAESVAKRTDPVDASQLGGSKTSLKDSSPFGTQADIRIKKSKKNNNKPDILSFFGKSDDEEKKNTQKPVTFADDEDPNEGAVTFAVDEDPNEGVVMSEFIQKDGKFVTLEEDEDPNEGVEMSELIQKDGKFVTLEEEEKILARRKAKGFDGKGMNLDVVKDTIEQANTDNGGAVILRDELNTTSKSLADNPEDNFRVKPDSTGRVISDNFDNLLPKTNDKNEKIIKKELDGQLDILSENTSIDDLIEDQNMKLAKEKQATVIDTGRFTMRKNPDLPQVIDPNKKTRSGKQSQVKSSESQNFVQGQFVSNSELQDREQKVMNTKEVIKRLKAEKAKRLELNTNQNQAEGERKVKKTMTEIDGMDTNFMLSQSEGRLKKKQHTFENLENINKDRAIQHREPLDPAQVKADLEEEQGANNFLKSDNANKFRAEIKQQAEVETINNEKNMFGVSYNDKVETAVKKVDDDEIFTISGSEKSNKKKIKEQLSQALKSNLIDRAIEIEENALAEQEESFKLDRHINKRIRYKDGVRVGYVDIDQDRKTPSGRQSQKQFSFSQNHVKGKFIPESALRSREQDAYNTKEVIKRLKEVKSGRSNNTTDQNRQTGIDKLKADFTDSDDPDHGALFDKYIIPRSNKQLKLNKEIFEMAQNNNVDPSILAQKRADMDEEQGRNDFLNSDDGSDFIKQLDNERSNRQAEFKRKQKQQKDDAEFEKSRIDPSTPNITAELREKEKDNAGIVDDFGDIVEMAIKQPDNENKFEQIRSKPQIREGGDGIRITIDNRKTLDNPDLPQTSFMNKLEKSAINQPRVKIGEEFSRVDDFNQAVDNGTVTSEGLMEELDKVKSDKDTPKETRRLRSIRIERYIGLVKNRQTKEKEDMVDPDKTIQRDDQNSMTVESKDAPKVPTEDPVEEVVEEEISKEDPVEEVVEEEISKEELKRDE